MSRIEVVKGSKTGKFRVLVNCIQDGCELSSAIAANTHAAFLKTRYPAYTVILVPVAPAAPAAPVTNPEKKV